MQTYTKINTLYKRYQFKGTDCPNQKWLKFKNKIILGDFSNIEAKYLFHNLWEAYSKIDGTNSKIAFFPSTGEIKIGGKSDNAESIHGQFEMLQAIAERIQPQLCAMFPKETARFASVKDGNKIRYYLENSYKTEDGGLGIEYHKTDDIQYDPTIPCFRGVELEEVPIYIYGEYFGSGVQKGGGRYIQNGNGFVVFDICQQGWWLPKENRDALCRGLNLETVPYIGNMTLADIEQMVMNGFPTRFDRAADPTLIEEGIVARPVVPICDGRGNRIIVKVKYCDYIEYKHVRDEFTDREFEEFIEWYYKSLENE